MPGEDAWTGVMEMVCELYAEISIPNFTVADILQLRKGFVVATNWSKGKDVPVMVNGVQIGWSEIEAPAECLTARLTEFT